MQQVIGLSYGGREICFLAEDFREAPEGQLRIPGTGAELALRRGGGITSVLRPDGAELPFMGAYWFAWHAAFPQGTIVTNITR